MAGQFAARLSLIAFAVVTLRGAIESAEFHGTMTAAMLAAAAFFGLGLVAGELARRTVEEIAHKEFEKLSQEQASTDDSPAEPAPPTA